MAQVPESQTESRVNVPMSAHLYERLRQAAFDERRSMAAITRDAIRTYLGNNHD